MTHTKMTEQQWNQLREEHEIAYLRGDLATSSPESYTIEEMKAISDGMFESTAKIDAALRADFESMPSEAQNKMLDLLQIADPEHLDWWKETLLGKIPDSPSEIRESAKR
jgi:hypothetical protein